MFGNLKVWQCAHGLALEVYRVTRRFPPEERYALVPQVRRAVVSVAANIAEGSKRASSKDRIHFYNIANASLEEAKYFLILSRDLAYISHKEFQALMGRAEEAGRMLSGLVRSIYKK